MKGIVWKAGIVLAVACVVFSGLYFVGLLDGILEPFRPYQSVRVEEIYKSIADFYSVAWDRNDLKEGTFKLWPGEGEKVCVYGILGSFSVKEPKTNTYTLTYREWPNRETIVIKTRIDTYTFDGYLEGWFVPKLCPVRVCVNKDEDQEILVPFRLEFNKKGISSDEEVQSLKMVLEGKQGQEVCLKGTITKIIVPASMVRSFYPDYSQQISTVVEYLQQYGVTILVDIHEIEGVWIK